MTDRNRNFYRQEKRTEGESKKEREREKDCHIEREREFDIKAGIERETVEFCEIFKNRHFYFFSPSL